jgi:hypothetical protein
MAISYAKRALLPNQSTSTFDPLGLTLSNVVTTIVSSLTIPALSTSQTVRLLNAGTETVFILINDATEATLLNAMPLLAGSAEVFFVSSDAVDAVVIQTIAANTGSTLYATLGRGN